MQGSQQNNYAYKQRLEKTDFAKLVFAEHYGRTHREQLDPSQLTKNELIKITLDYAENSSEYRESVKAALTADYCLLLTGTPKTQLQGILRIFERTFFWYVAEHFQEDYQTKWSALNSNDKSLQGFCKYVAPSRAERTKFFTQLRKDIETPSASTQIEGCETSEAQQSTPENSETSEESRTATPLDYIEFDENGNVAGIIFDFWDE